MKLVQVREGKILFETEKYHNNPETDIINIK